MKTLNFKLLRLYSLNSNSYYVIKRIVVIMLIILSLPVTILLSLMIVIMIKMERQEDIFFIQIRPGKNGVPFKMYKFCTMERKESGDFELTKKNDQRVTPVGKWLRKTRLDELPQLLNIIKGDMDLIGPRPVPWELYDFYRKNIVDYDLRHKIRPGITGLAQVQLGYTSTLDGEKRKVEYDKEYIRNQSLKLDYYIVKKTFLHLFKSNDTARISDIKTAT